MTMRNPKTILLVALGHVYQTILGFVCEMALVVHTCMTTRNSLEKGQWTSCVQSCHEVLGQWSLLQSTWRTNLLVIDGLVEFEK